MIPLILGLVAKATAVRAVIQLARAVLSPSKTQGPEVSGADSEAYVIYRYDAGGQRVSKSVNGVRQDFLWNGGDIAKEYTASGAVKADYFLGAGREGIKTNGHWYYYLSDIQGSTLMLTDANGNSAATWDYSDYGETRQTSGSTSLYNPFLYTGQEYDFETSLYHLRARHYSPGLGRFFSRDPIGYAGGSNMMGYCGGDPVNPSRVSAGTFGRRSFLG